MTFIAVIGPSGAGKSSCCNAAKERLGCGYADLDSLIQHVAGVESLGDFRDCVNRISQDRFFDLGVRLCEVARLAAERRKVLVAVGAGQIDYANSDLGRVQCWLRGGFDDIITVIDNPENAHARSQRGGTLEQYKDAEFSQPRRALYDLSSIRHEVGGKNERDSQNDFVQLIKSASLD